MKTTTIDAWIVTKRPTYDKQDRAFLVADAPTRDIRVWSRHGENAILFRAPALADEYVRRLKSVWLGDKIVAEKVQRLEMR